MEMLKLAMQSSLPLIYIRTDDIINVEEVLSFLAGEQVVPLELPPLINAVSDMKVPKGRVFYTSSECKSLAKVYHFCVDQEKTIVFVNTEKSVLQFDGGVLFPPKELVHKFLAEISDEPDALMPAFGGMTLKDVGEVAKMTMTRDESITPRGVNETRRGYSKPRGITQVDTAMSYYMEPSYLHDWLEDNAKFFTNPVHESLTPRGLLFDGPPGTGKTLASKHIAATFGVPLYRLDLGAMMGKYVGESEHVLNAALSQLDQVVPCVAILDEVEKIFKEQSDSGVTSRLLSQLLWWMQERKSQVFVVMTTNDLKAIPEELYREGRIDAVMDFLGIETKDSGQEFAIGAYEALLAELKREPTNAGKATLAKKVGSLYIDKKPVPQARLSKVATDQVKEELAKELDKEMQ